MCLFGTLHSFDSVFSLCFSTFLLGISIELVGKQVRVSTDMAIFITMNPGYAGRSNLPDNLKKLFRSLAMTKPDRQLIAEVNLFFILILMKNLIIFTIKSYWAHLRYYCQKYIYYIIMTLSVSVYTVELRIYSAASPQPFTQGCSLLASQSDLGWSLRN